MNIFIKEMGRFSDHTRTTFVTMYQILKQMGRTEDLADLESDWESVDPKELETLKGFHPEDVDLFEKEMAKKEVMQKLEMPEMPKAPDLSNFDPTKHKPAPPPEEPKKEETDEVTFESLDNLDPFFGTPRTQTIGFSMENKPGDEVTPGFLDEELPRLQRIPQRNKLPRTNPWRFFRFNEIPFDPETTPKEPELSENPELVEPKKKTQRKPREKKEPITVTVDKSGALASSDQEWKRREEQVKELKKRKPRAKKGETDGNIEF